MTVGKWFVLVSHLFSRYISMKGREQSWPFRLPRRREYSKSVGEGGGAYCFLIKWMNPRLLDARKAAEKFKFFMDVSSACHQILKKYPCFPIGVGL